MGRPRKNTPPKSAAQATKPPKARLLRSDRVKHPTMMRRVESAREFSADRDALADAIVEEQGNLARLAIRFGATRRAIDRFITNDPDLSQIMFDVRESVLDDAESTLIKQWQNGDTSALMFFLETKGKSRGYTRRFEQVVDTRPIQIEVTWGENAFLLAQDEQLRLDAKREPDYDIDALPLPYDKKVRLLPEDD